MNDPLHNSLIATAERYGMLSHGTTVVVAVSGGQDSCALLHALNSLRGRWAISLHAAHFNHCLRGSESDEDARFVKQLAGSLGLPVTIESGDVAGAAKRSHRSLHEAARTMRHRFLDQVAGDVDASGIAVAHTRDDRLESVLHNILRGTGIDGLQGIAPRAGKRVRPLIDVSRQETAAYCERHGIQFRTDPSNVSPAYARSRIRTELLPELEAYYNPAVRDALRRLSDLAVEDAAFLREEAQRQFDRLAVNIAADQVVFEVECLRRLPIALRRRVLRQALERVRGGLHNVEFETTGAVMKAIEGGAGGGRFQLTVAPGDTRIGFDGESVRFTRVNAASSSLAFEQPLHVPGVTRIEPWGLEIVTEPELGPRDSGGRCLMSVIVDRSAIRGQLVVRNRRPGDRLRPIGMTGSRKVQDILTDRKAPAAERDRIPIVADEEGILWVVGHALADRARITEDTVSALRMHAAPLSSE